MNNETDIFDLKDISDLPTEVCFQLEDKGIHVENKGRHGAIYLKILELFRIKEVLSFDEIAVGLFRKFGLKKSRNQLSASIARLYTPPRVYPYDPDSFGFVYIKEISTKKYMLLSFDGIDIKNT